MDKKKKFSKRNVFLYTGILVLILFLIFFNPLSFISPNKVKDFILSFGMFAPVIYIVLYGIGIFIPNVAPLLSIVGGLTFGKLYGTIFTVLTASVVSIFPFLSARKLGKKWVKKKMSGKVEALFNRYDEKPFLFVLYMRLVPVIPYEVQNYIAGITRASIPTFFFATLIGILPGTFAFAYLGEGLGQFGTPAFWWAILVFVLALGGPAVIAFSVDKYVESRKEKNKKR